MPETDPTNAKSPEGSTPADESPNWMAEGDKVAGSAEHHVALRAWARTNMPKHELEEMNARASKDPSYYPKMIRTISDRQARGGGEALDGAPFRTPREMHLAQDESTHKFGHWKHDPRFMARLEATPKSVRTATF